MHLTTVSSKNQELFGVRLFVGGQSTLHQTQALAPGRPDVKIKIRGLGQYDAEPHYST